MYLRVKNLHIWYFSLCTGVHFVCHNLPNTSSNILARRLNAYNLTFTRTLNYVACFFDGMIITNILRCCCSRRVSTFCLCEEIVYKKLDVSIYYYLSTYFNTEIKLIFISLLLDCSRSVSDDDVHPIITMWNSIYTIHAKDYEKRNERCALFVWIVVRLSVKLCLQSLLD